MGTVLTENELKRHLPELSRRLNAHQLAESLSGELGDTDMEIVERKLNSTEPGSATIRYMYRALKRHLGNHHVTRFLQAVQDQFEDLTSLGILLPAGGPEGNAAHAQYQAQHQPVTPLPARDFRPRQHLPHLHHPGHTEQGPATHTAPETSPRFSYPDPSKCVQHVPVSFLPPPPPRTPHYTPVHPSQPFDPHGYVKGDHPSMPSGGGKSSHATSGFHSAQGGFPQSAESWEGAGGGALQRLLRSEAREGGGGRGVIPPPGSRPCGSFDEGITVQEILANISRNNAASAPLPHHRSQSMPVRSSESVPVTDSSALVPIRLGEGAVSAGGGRFAPVGSGLQPTCGRAAEDGISSNCGRREPADLALNIMESVENNAFADTTEHGGNISLQGDTSQGLTGHPSAQGAGHLASLSQGRSNVQTDGDLSAEDVQPEQPEDPARHNGGDGGGAGLGSQFTVPTVGRTAAATNIIIKKIVVYGEGNHVNFSDQNVIETIFSSGRGSHDDHPPVILNSAGQLTGAMPNAGPAQNSQQSSDRTEHLQGHQNTSHHTACQQTHLQREPQHLTGSAGSLENVGDTAIKQPTRDLSDNCDHPQTRPKEPSQHQGSSTQLRQCPYTSGLSTFCYSDYILHHDTQVKMERRNQTEPAEGTMSHLTESHGGSNCFQTQDTQVKMERRNQTEDGTASRMIETNGGSTCDQTYDNQVNLERRNQPEPEPEPEPEQCMTPHVTESHGGSTRDGTQDRAVRGTGQEAYHPGQGSSSLSHVPCSSDFSSQQDPSMPMFAMSKPGVLLGPEELQRFEAQRDASVEIPACSALPAFSTLISETGCHDEEEESDTAADE
ncbi:uncharacterized protein LOC143293895 [Babylonia areolata]|uniref:uncharacterized protein LOC143293895 n=1 Tax=Babylonia areolata TaxID=304850 RepID=UPI003FD69040